MTGPNDPEVDETLPPPSPERRGGWMIPVLAFVAGGGVALLATGLSRPVAPPIAKISVDGLSAPTAPTGERIISATEAEVELYRQINEGFVAQLRKYEDRLRAISDLAEAEGAESAARQMREFALETGLVIERYDLIVKNPQ